MRQDSFIKEKMKPSKRFIVKGTGSHFFSLRCVVRIYQLGKLDNKIFFIDIFVRRLCCFFFLLFLLSF